MGGVAAALGLSGGSHLVVAQSLSLLSTFEWGSPSVLQTAWATDSYDGRRRLDHLRFLDGDGRERFGACRLVVRLVDGVGENFVVVHLLRWVAALPCCSLTRTGCRLLAWSFPRPVDP
eukprot:TRINITY_DN2985_c0_g1_i1.p2 TRINITY_DN2985_c0_g1~~TRINITY_DN2985_c0_g1_i1.p2  ORF type:complete len:118 (+),score=19.01 TRINITY_DN2985_c0_g1_i1:282-635(+)